MNTELNGFIDLQNNGWMGADFTAPGLTLERVREITLELVERGTIAFCPTVITGDPDVYRENLRVLSDAMRDPTIGPHIPGIHLEGPFISPEPGAVGAHPRSFVKEPSVESFKTFQEWARGGIRILTLAPERPGAEALIRYASSTGVLVSIGHNLASGKDLAMALAAGARLCTHVGNGCPNLIHRHDNPLWWQLACDEMTGLFITDGHHLPADLIKVALRAKGPERFVVTSDASSLAGMPPGNYSIFNGLSVTVDEKGKIYSESSKSLAGSHATMMDCMNYMASLNLLDEKGLMQVGFFNQAALLRLDVAAILKLKGPRIRFINGRFIAN